MASGCCVCSKTAYPLERVIINDRVFHERCFKCCVCMSKLQAGTFASLNGLFYCRKDYHTILTTSDEPEGVFFTVLVDDVVKVILSHLEHAELARIATINRIFHKNCTALLPLYPQQIKLEPINAPYNGMQRNYVYQYTVVALPEDLIKVDRIEFHVEPNKLIGPPYVLEVPLDGSQLIFNVRHCAHVDYELSCSFFTVAYKGACGTRSAVVHRKLPPTSEIDGTRHIMASCFDGNTLITLPNDEYKMAKDIKNGDFVLGGDGRVHQVLKVDATPPSREIRKKLVCLHGLWLTRGHPVMLNSGEWYRPDELSTPVEVPLHHGLFNFLLSGKNATVIARGSLDSPSMTCSTLGTYCGPRIAAMHPENHERFCNAYAATVS